ncbi:hypothetical protein ABBQ32_013543 [Trebouxia sp. C0010 RCD-2024]
MLKLPASNVVAVEQHTQHSATLVYQQFIRAVSIASAARHTARRRTRATPEKTKPNSSDEQMMLAVLQLKKAQEAHRISKGQRLNTNREIWDACCLVAVRSEMCTLGL